MIIIEPKTETRRMYLLRTLYLICKQFHVSTQEAEQRIKNYALEQSILYREAFDEFCDIATDLWCEREMKKEAQFDNTFGY